ncbi:hypothetical protein CRG98_034083 [Punica granatum]|uniref:Reverse transcriptase domain-containing protein n=1 Tax=Punica granatum TaxID=22663 RepID=A0A2I0INI2_PUNGR|nr:hypothetical protein CRG98_034083 [Punica granatum]
MSLIRLVLLDEITDALLFIKPYKSPGPDGLQACFYQRCWDVIGSSEQKCSFIPGRRSSDNVILLREVIHYFRKRKGTLGNFVIKLDLEKAFDRLEWGFIHKVLHHFDFSVAWIDWLMTCVSSTSTSIILNGSCLDSFTHSRGIRQGDRISPYIFIFYMEYMVHLIEDKVHLQVWKGVKPTRSCFDLAHLLFTDNILLMGITSPATINAITFVLQLFCMESGMKINLGKSKLIFSKSTSMAQQLQTCSAFNIQETYDLGKYLGFPIGLSPHKEKDFHFVVEKVRAKLAGWKASMLSMKKIHLVSWEFATRPKNLGGLGIPSMNLHNKALLENFVSRAASSREPWAGLLHQQFNTYNPARLTKGSNNWRGLLVGMEMWEKGGKWLIGDEISVRFWLDRWVGGKPLRNIIYEPLPAHEEDRRVSFVMMPNCEWNFFSLPFDLPQSIRASIQGLPTSLSHDTPDSIIWGLSNDGNFSTKSAYLLHYDHLEPSEDTWDWLWKCPTLPRIQYFTWLCHKDRLPTASLLAQRGLAISPLCPHCPSEPKTIDHILRGCPLARTFWLQLQIPHSKLGTFNFSVKDWLRYNIASSHDSHLHIPWGNPGLAGAGGLIQDSLGIWVTSFRMNLGCTTSPAAELKALRQGLIATKECGINDLVVELDAKLILSWVWGKSSNMMLTNLINDSRNLCQQFDTIIPKHTYREANICVDHLAFHG